MARIELVAVINAPVQRCFDLARSVDFHVISSTSTCEKAIAGKTKGLIELNDEVTFKARHFGITQTLTSRIIEFNAPYYFTDCMLKGAFKSLTHRHSFEGNNGITRMADDFQYEVPMDGLGEIFDLLILRNYMRKFLINRNNLLKKALESEDWKNYLINTV